MPKTTVGLRFGPSTLSLVSLKAGFKGTVVEQVRSVEFKGGDRLKALTSLNIAHGASLAASLGADAVFQRVVEVPFTDRLRAARSAPLEAEESLPLPLEKLVVHSHILEKRTESSLALVLATPAEKVRQLLESLSEAGLEPEVVSDDHAALATVALSALPSALGIFVLDLEGSSCQAVFMGQNGAEKYYSLSGEAGEVGLLDEIDRLTGALRDEGKALRGVYLTGPDADIPDLAHWRVTLGLPVEVMPYPKKAAGAAPDSAPAWPSWAIPLGLALGANGAGQAQRVNFLAGPFARGGGEAVTLRSRLMVMGSFIAVLIALWAASVGVEAAYKKKQLDSINNSVRQLFSAALPEVKNVVDEVAQLKQRKTEQEERARILGSLLRKEVSPLRVLKEMSDRLPPDLKVEFREFNAEPERIRIEGETTTFDAIDKIQAKLSEYPWFTSITISDAKSAVDQSKVIFRMTLTLGQKDLSQ